MTTQPTRPIEIFYSYAHTRKDEALRKELENHLTLLQRQGYISGWHNRKIVPGQVWEEEIDAHLNTARVILLLVSSDFLASDYCYGTEVKRAIERHEAGEALVIPIILREVAWRTSPFGKLQALPTDGKPVTSWSNRDAAFHNVAEGIRSAIEMLPGLRPANSQASQARQTSTTNAGTNEGMERPATALLSYAREDVGEVKYLQMQLKVRGVRAWRDVTDLPLGGATENEIVHAIENIADAFVLYVTPHALNSDFVWDIEIPAALKRQKSDPLFNIVPVLKDVSFQQLQQQCVARGYRSLTDFNAVRLPDSSSGTADKSLKEILRFIAERVLKATMTLRLRRAKADRNYEPFIVLRTFKDIPPTSSLDLDLDWWDLFQDRDRLASVEEWRDVLFPALQDVKNVLGELPVSRNLHMSLNAILPTAFALGFAFPAPARYTLLLESKDGTWSTAGAANASSPLQSIPYSSDGNKQTAIVEIAITQSISQAVTDYLSASHLSYGRRILFNLPDGPDHINGVKDAAHALAIARQIGRELRVLSGQGVAHIHLFAAIPAPLAVLLGNQFNALCPVSVYQFADRQYKRACTLGSIERVG